MIARAGFRRRAMPGWALRWGTLLLALALWEAAGQAVSSRFLIAAPSDILAYLTANAGLVGRALWVTVQAAGAGFVLGNLAAVALACVALLLPRMAWLISGLALLIFCLPLVATGPILRVLYGPGTGPQITLAALAVYYTTYLPLLVGLRAAPASWFDLVHTYGRGRVSELVRIRFHAAVPYFLSGLQIAAPAAFLGAMVGEFTGAERGIGVLTIRAIGALDVPGTWALAAVASAVSILSYLALGAVGQRLGTHPRELLLAPPRAARPRPAHRRALGGLARAVALVTVVLLLWYGLMEGFGLNAFFAKRPADVLAFLVTVPEAAANRATLLDAFAQTMVLAVPGYLAGLGLGALLAAGVVLVPGLGAAVLPLAIALRSVPIVTTAPLLVLALGRGATGTITIVAVMIFFPTLVACLTGLRQTPGQAMDLFDTYAAPRWQRLMLAQVPAMLPAFFAAARMAVPAALLAATTAEWLATGIGMGSLMALTASTSSYAMLWAAIVLLATTAMLAYAAVELLERRVLRIYASEQHSL